MPGQLPAHQLLDEDRPDGKRRRQGPAWPGSGCESPERKKAGKGGGDGQGRREGEGSLAPLWRGFDAGPARTALPCIHCVSSDQNVPAAISGELPTSFSPPSSAKTL